MGQQKPIDIVITTWKREWMTKLCLKALRNNTQTPHRIILIDNGSDKESQKEYLDVDIYVKLDKNYGLEYAKNLGMKFVESELFISTDNDILVYKYEPDWLSRLIDLMNRHQDYGAIALRPQILVGTGNIFENAAEEIVEFSHVPGYARIMRTNVVNETGAWNDKRPLRGHEEMWISERLRERGWKVGWARDIKCWHLFGQEDTDEWGYPKGMKPEEHGHNPVYPMPKNDIETIRREVGIWDIQ